MSPKTHPNAVLTVLIDKLNSCCCAVKAAPLNGPCRWTLNGYAGSPYKQRGWPVGAIQCVSNIGSKPDTASTPLSCLLP